MLMLDPSSTSSEQVQKLVHRWVEECLSLRWTQDQPCVSWKPQTHVPSSCQLQEFLATRPFPRRLGREKEGRGPRMQKPLCLSWAGRVFGPLILRSRDHKRGEQGQCSEGREHRSLQNGQALSSAPDRGSGRLVGGSKSFSSLTDRLG